MKNTVKSNFSLRKLILTALVAGPVAILPAPLWALPSTAATNLTTSAGVSVVTAGTALNITSPDKGILTWVNFGGGGETIATTDTLNYILPSSSASVLNLVSGATTTTINGTLVSNGNVYVMNPNGIVIGSGATINTGGFYASAINEPLAASSFASTGTLSFVGTGSGSVTVSHTNSLSTAPVFQALGSGNNIVLAGGSSGVAVDVQTGSFFGNLTTRSTGGAIAIAGSSSQQNVANSAGTASTLTPGTSYIITTPGSTDFAAYGATGTNAGSTFTANSGPTAVAASTVTVGKSYTITTAGGTNFTLLGASNNNVGATFTAKATNVGGGTGTVTAALGSGVVVQNNVSLNNAVSVSGNLSVVSNGGNVSLSGAGATATYNSNSGNLPAPVAGSLPTGVNLISGGGSGSGYAPSSTVVVTFAAPTVALVNGTTSYNQTVFGTQATGQYITDSTGRITDFRILTGGSGYTAAPTYSLPLPTNNTLTVAGNLNVTTAGGSVKQDNDNRVSVTGTSTFNTAGTSSSYGTVSLGNVDFSTLNLTSVGKTSISDKVGSLTLGNGTVTATGSTDDTELTLSANASSGSTISMASGAKITVAPSASNTNPKISLTSTSSGITYTGVGSMTFSTVSTSTTATASISGDKDITVPSYGGKGLSVTTSGGSITSSGISRTDATLKLATTGLGDITYNSNSLYTSGSVDIQASNGKVTVGTGASVAMSVGGSSILKATNGDVTVNGALAATSGITIQSTTGQVSLTGAFAGNGTISAASSVVLGTADANSKADISGGTVVMSSLNAATGSAAGGVISYTLPTNLKLGAGYNPNSNYDITFGGAGGSGSAGYATTDSSGRVSSVTITAPGSGYTTAATFAITTGQNPSNSVVANGALAITAGSGSITIPGPIVSTSTSELSLSSAQTLTLNSNITAPTLKLTSTGSNISQTGGAIVSTSKATISAATNVSLDPGAANNDFNQIVVTNTPGGATITDKNSIVVAGGTDTKGDLVVKAGQAAASQVVTIASPIATYSTPTVAATQNLNAVSTTNTVAGTVVGLTIPTSTGYTPGTSVPVTFSAPPAPAAPTAINAYSTAASTSAGTTGSIVSNGGITKVNVQFPVGYGYAPNSRVPVTFTQTGTNLPAGANADGYTTTPQGYATVNSNGQISGVVITDPGTGAAQTNNTQTISFASPTAAGQPWNGGMSGVPASDTASGVLIAGADGKLSTLVLSNTGAGYFGSFIPTATIGAAATGVTARAEGVYANVAGATTGVSLAGLSTVTNPNFAIGTALTGGSNYASAPAVTMSNGSTATANVTNGVVTSIYTAPTGTIALGTASSDVIKVGGNLSLTSSTPSGTVTTSASTTADNAVVSTVANSISVTGAISATNNGAAVTFGNAAPIGTTTAYNFGSVAASIGSGNLTINSNGALALGTITANSLTAKSVSGDITNTGAVTLAAGATLTAKDIFAPGNITLNNAGNAIQGTIVVTNAKDFSLTNTQNVALQAGSATVVGSAMTGLTSVTTSSGKNIVLTAQGGGDYGVVSFNAGGNVTITDPNGVTIRNATNTGVGTVTVNAAGPINLDSGITLASSGATTLNATGATGTITDTAAGISVYGPATFSSSNGISITKAGHSFGPVTLTSGTIGATATTSDIVYTESGTANLAGVTAGNNGSVSITSTNGGIIQSAGNIALTGALTATQQTATFTAASGVTLSRNTNSFGGAVVVPVTLTAGADSSVSANSALTLGNVRVNGGTFTVDTTNSALAGGAVAQAANTTAAIYGNTSVTTKGSAITLTNSGNNFGALSLATNVGTGALAGADIALTEGGTLNVNSVNAGANGKVALNSENGNIIQTATGTGLTVSSATATAGGFVIGQRYTILTPGTTNYTLVGSGDNNVGTSFTATGVGAGTGTAYIGSAAPAPAISLTAAKGSITLTGTNNSNGAPITLSTTGNVALTDTATAATKLANGTTVGGTTTIRNTSGTATLSDVSGGILLGGAVLVDMTGAAGTGNISITGSGNSFGAFQFRASNVTIAEDKTLNIAAGSLATGIANLSSLADIITTGAGSSIFSGPTTSLTLSAGGNITITNPIAVANGLTFRALGAVDLSALSMANLNGKTPTNLGAASYKAPQP